MSKINEPDYFFSLAFFHGCRDHDNIITLPQNIWVINSCEDDMMVTSGGRVEKMMKFKDKLKENISAQEKIKFLLNLEKEDEQKKNIKMNTFSKYFCVVCPGQQLYDIALSFKPLGVRIARLIHTKNKVQEKQEEKMGLYMWTNNYEKARSGECSFVNDDETSILASSGCTICNKPLLKDQDIKCCRVPSDNTTPEQLLCFHNKCWEAYQQALSEDGTLRDVEKLNMQCYFATNSNPRTGRKIESGFVYDDNGIKKLTVSKDGKGPYLPYQQPILRDITLQGIIEKIQKDASYNTNKKYIIFVSACVHPCESTLTKRPSSLRSSTSLVKQTNVGGDGGKTKSTDCGECILGRPRLGEYNFNNNQCSRPDTEETRNELRACHALKKFELCIGNTVELLGESDPLKDKLLRLEIVGYEGRMVKLKFLGAENENYENKGIDWKTLEKHATITFKQIDKYSKMQGDQARIQDNNTNIYGKQGQIHSHLPRINIDYKNFIYLYRTGFFQREKFDSLRWIKTLEEIWEKAYDIISADERNTLCNELCKKKNETV